MHPEYLHLDSYLEMIIFRIDSPAPIIEREVFPAAFLMKSDLQFL